MMMHPSKKNRQNAQSGFIKGACGACTKVARAALASVQKLYTLSVFLFTGSRNTRQGLAKASHAFSPRLQTCPGPVRSAQAGFTLVETLVAITVLILAIVGPMTIASRGLQSAYYAREQLAAVYLAQEGIEYVRDIRDENALTSGTGTDWLSGLDNCISASGCGVDMRSSSAPFSCGSQSCRLNYANSMGTARGMYTYQTSGATQSLYTRVVKVTETVDNREALVTSSVTWSTGIFGGVGSKTITLQSRIFNQYDGL